MDKKEDEEMKGIRKFSTFVTADTLLAAVLLVWAQIWIQPSVQLWAAWYGKKEQPGQVIDTLQTFDLNVGVGLIWTYFAVFLALLALAWAVLSSLKNPNTDEVHAWPLGLFVFSAGMALGDVLQSVFSVSIKLIHVIPVFWSKMWSPNYSNWSIWEPLRPPCSLLPGVVLFAPLVALLCWCAYNWYACIRSKSRG